MATNLETVIENFCKLAGDSFDAAAAQARSPKPQDNPGDDDVTRDKKAAMREAYVAKAKAQMMSSLQQLAQGDAMLSQLKTRESYRTLLGQIVNQNTALGTLVKETGLPGDQPALAQLISAHATLLQALANIAPLTA